MRIRRALATVAVLAVSAGALTACQDASTAGSQAGSSSSASPSKSASGDGGHLDEDTLVDAISTGPLKAGSAHLSMTMDGAMALSAEGDVSYRDGGPEMSMRMDIPQMGAGKMELRLVDGILYLTIPTLTPAGKFLRIDPQDKSNPLTKSFGSLSDQMDPLASIAAMKTAVRDVSFVGSEQVDGVDTDRYRVTVDTAAMTKAMKQKSVAGMPETLTYDLWLDSDDLLRRLRFELAGQKVEMTMSKWGEPVSVQAPPPAELVDPSQLGALAG